MYLFHNQRVRLIPTDLTAKHYQGDTKSLVERVRRRKKSPGLGKRGQ